MSGGKKAKAGHHVETVSLGELAKAYPHDPEDLGASMADYLDAKQAEGLHVVSSHETGGALRFMFRAS